jgi:hypothetical protein
VPDEVALEVAQPRTSRRGAAYTAAIVAIVTLITFGGWLKWSAKLLPGAPATSAAAKTVAGSAIDRSEVRILAGYVDDTYSDRLGGLWLGDRYFSGGSVFGTIGHPIMGARDPRIYQNRREGTFGYDIPLAPGAYELRLHFAETLYGENNAAGGAETSRLFNIYINGAKVLDQFDVIEDAGANEADIRAFKDVSPAADGKLHLKFESYSNPAFINAIEVTPGMPGHLGPIRMVARDHPYTGRDGRRWEPDWYARGGRLVTRTEPADGADDPELFRGERFGNIHYVVSAPPGKYAVTFYFAETWFGPGKAAGGGAGSRLFDILSNGVALRRNFDIYKEAGGANRALRFTAHGLTPNAQGKLVISLQPVRNYACVDAIEIVDETK